MDITSENMNSPQLRVALTPQCNLKCIYCRPGGEGYAENLHVKINAATTIQLINLCAQVGFTHIKFTGGEPLLRQDLEEIIQKTKNIKTIKEIQLVTNGVLLKKRAKSLRDSGVDWITISLDAADADAYLKIRGTNLATIISAIDECKSIGLPVRLNMVVMKANFDQIAGMIDLASNLGCSLKLLDLIYLGKNELEFWKTEFIHFDSVRDSLVRMGAKYIGLEDAPGGIGAPLTEFRFPNGLQVVVKDSTRGTYYHPSCKECKNYPCQDALISVRLTHDGMLKRCLIRNDNLIPAYQLLSMGEQVKLEQELADIFNLMVASEYYPFAWDPSKLA